ncbi:MAG: hypothetical protein IPL61_14570 [Myxococcales bacterium]|nr:hypothetical protein [Myxococcales bacterium]
MRSGLLALTLAACAADPGAGGDVTGPFTGTTHRFVVDRIAVPTDAPAADAIADDLDGDGDLDDHFGAITAVLASIGDLSRDGDDMIASGALASTVELIADDLGDDDAVGLRYLGADGAPATIVGGALRAGRFVPNRTATTRAPGQAVARLPIYTNADPLALTVDGLAIELAPDGAGGYDGIARGGLREAHARAAAYAGLLQMFATEPARHVAFARGVDSDRDGVITTAELDASVIAVLVTADVQLWDGATYAPRASHATPDSVSLAFTFHLTPCAAGRCTIAAPAAPCRDRVRDGDETDVDCGGSCQPCAADLACLAPADCQAPACVGGRCAAPRCDDGVTDGLESDVDCGGACGPCQPGQACVDDGDCGATRCAGGTCAAAG